MAEPPPLMGDYKSVGPYAGMIFAAPLLLAVAIYAALEPIGGCEDAGTGTCRSWLSVLGFLATVAFLAAVAELARRYLASRRSRRQR